MMVMMMSMTSDHGETGGDDDCGRIVLMVVMVAVQLLVKIIMMMGILKIIKMVMEKKLARAVKTRPERLSGIYAMSGNSMNTCYSESDICLQFMMIVLQKN